MVDVPDGGARADGEASSSHTCPSEEDTPPVVLLGFVNGGQPLEDATRAGETWWPRGTTTEDAAGRLVAWTREGGSARALLVVSVGSVASAALTVLLIFAFFLAAAATAAIVASIVMSLAAAGGFLSVLFTFLVAMYVGALSVAVFVVSATTVAAVVAITISTGWAALFWILWFSAKQFMDFAKF